MAETETDAEPSALAYSTRQKYAIAGIAGIAGVVGIGGGAAGAVGAAFGAFMMAGIVALGINAVLAVL